LSVPTGATINGITVGVTASSTDTGTQLICVGLSPNGGTSTTTAQSTGDVTSTVATFTLGGVADTWGRTWSASEFSNANFRVYLMPDPSNSNARNYFVDKVDVNVFYTAPGTSKPLVATDRSGQGNNGTLTNGPQRTIGKIGQGLSFDGVDDYVSITDQPILRPGNSSWSVSAWAKMTTSVTERYIVNRVVPQ
jgi:hypothetical protein